MTTQPTPRPTRAQSALVAAVAAAEDAHGGPVRLGPAFDHLIRDVRTVTAARRAGWLERTDDGGVPRWTATRAGRDVVARTVTRPQIPTLVRAMDVLSGGERTVAEAWGAGVRIDVLRRLAGEGLAHCTRDTGDNTSRYALTDYGQALAAPTDPAQLRPGLILIHRMPAVATLVQVRSVIAGEVWYRPVDEWGLSHRRRGLMPLHMPVHTAFVLLFVPYRPCRWELDCLAQATTTVHVRGYGSRYDPLTAVEGPVDTCPRHAVEHRQWETENSARRGDEPVPGCMCTDEHLHSLGEPVDYCPRHSADPLRGTNMDPRTLLAYAPTEHVR